MSKLTLSFKGKVLKVYPVLKGSMSIGSDPSCTIHIDSLAVQPKHAQIDTVDNNSVIRDLGSEDGIYLNQDKIDGLKPLQDGDFIRIGKHNLAYTFENIIENTDSAQEPVPDTKEEAAPAAEHNDNRQGWLQIMSGQNLGKTMSLNRSMTNLGKPGVSTAVITRRNGGYFISHLEGEQSPIVKNEAIGSKSLQLEDGDIIQIGNIKMQFYLE